jgi:prophage DNA circulation protein
LKDKAADLVHTPEKLAKQITDALRGVVTSIEKARDQFKALGSMFHHGSDDKPVPVTTSTREQQATNQTQINRLVQVATVSLGAQRAVEIPFESTKDAREVRAEIVDNIERHEEESTDDETFQALVDVKTETIKGIPAPEEALPTIGTVTLAKTTPSVVMTYDLYENPIYEDDILLRNKVAHPGFVPGGEPLEVLQVDG